jgi:FkbM family methyltransferase
MTLDGVSVRFPPAAEHDIAYFARNQFGLREAKAFVTIARRGGCLLDIGGHRGILSALFCAAAPGNRSYCFEPSQALAEAARALALDNGFSDRLEVLEAAVGESAGKRVMLLDPVGGFVQVKRFKNSMWGEPVKVEVRLETIDEFCDRERVVPTLLKVDVEGYEYEVILGSRQVLTRFRPTVFLELHLNYLEDRGIAARAVLGVLRELNYTFTLLDGTSVTDDRLCDCPLDRVHLIADPVGPGLT